MRTISDEIRSMIMNTPFLEEAMRRELINYSALAREFLPELEKKLMKDLSEGAVMMAIKRLARKLPGRVLDMSPEMKKRMRMTVRSDLMEYTFEASHAMMSLISKLTGSIANPAEDFFTFTRGTHEVTMIFSSALQKQIDPIFEGQKLISQLKNLASVSIKLPEQTVTTPGTHYSILKQLAWNHINIVEVVSTYTELSIVLKLDDVDRAFSILIQYFQK